MKKEMSSFDVRSIVTEMAALEGAHMDKIYHWGAGNVLFRLNVQGEGKKELFFKDKKWLYCPSVKPETPTLPTSFASFLRKYIDNARVGKVRQVGFDRIVEMELSKSDGDYRLIFEMFGGGNVLLVKDGTILNCLVQKTWKDRKTRPGEPYLMPKTRFDPTDSSEEDFLRSFRASDSDCVRTLATSVNLGGQYAEEVCKRVGIDKSTPASQVDDGTVAKMYAVMRDIVNHVVADPEPTAFLKDGQIQDLAPIDMMSHEDLEKQRYESMSKLIDAFLVQIQEDEEEAFVDPRVEKLNKRIAKQEETLEEYREQCEIYRRKAEALYTDYARVSELLTVLLEQSSKLTWDKLKEGASKIPFVSAIDPSKNTVTGTFAGENAETALNESRTELAKLEKGIAKIKAEMAGKAQPTKQFWFERYKWFITTGGRLVIAGRDAHTNDNVVKKHLKEGDLYAHADVHGAPSVIIKDGAKASNDELREACLFALAQSKSWIAALAEGTAFWAYPDQVSKTPNPGEFVPRGAFIIRGKRNYEHHLPLELAVGEIYYQNARKVMCGPVSCFEKSDRYFVIKPGKKTGRMSNEMAKRFDVPEEEVSRILPPGDVEIVREVWPRDDEESEGQ